MGNLSFIVPTENIEDYNIDSIEELFKDNLEFEIITDKKWNSIQILLDNNIVTELYFNQECYTLNFEEDIKYLLEEMNDTFLASELKNLQDNLKVDLNKIIQMTYGNLISSWEYSERKEVEKLLHSHFKAYIFDEGIHPEYIHPNYKWKEN